MGVLLPQQPEVIAKESQKKLKENNTPQQLKVFHPCLQSKRQAFIKIFKIFVR